jgi:uncharacterized protein (DUF924 family)
MTPIDVLDFWFGAAGTAQFGTARALWFRKSPVTDDLIRTRFGADVETALRGEHDDWAHSPRGALALILLLDQFTRNIHRDSPGAFAGDARALELARSLVASGAHLELAPIERWFAYMPFQHAESIEMQRESVCRFEQLAETGLRDPLQWAHRHYEVIARFGRFPHRNEILGRASTPAEIEFLKQTGSRF